MESDWFQECEVFKLPESNCILTLTQLQEMYQSLLKEFETLMIFFGVLSSKAKSKDMGEVFRLLKEFIVHLLSENKEFQAPKSFP